MRVRNADAETLQRRAVRNAFYAYQTMTPKQRADYGTPKRMCNSDAVPFTFFLQRTRQLACFRAPYLHRGALIAALNTLVDCGFLARLSPQETLGRYNSENVAYKAGALQSNLQVSENSSRGVESLYYNGTKTASTRKRVGDSR